LHAKISHLLYPKVGIGRESVPYEAAGEAPLEAKISWYGLGTGLQVSATGIISIEPIHWIRR
jgi:hypothetical protein